MADGFINVFPCGLCIYVIVVLEDSLGINTLSTLFSKHAVLLDLLPMSATGSILPFQ